MAVSAPQLYKVLVEDGSSFHGGRGRWAPGRWRSVRGELIPCQRGLHVVTVAQLPAWLGPAIWRVEVRGELIDAGDKMVARRARITERVAAWDERTARLFAADCAERVLPVFERERPGDNRPREAIAVARRYANGAATREDLAAARVAAGDAEGAAWAAWAAWTAGAWAARAARVAARVAGAAESARAARVAARVAATGDAGAAWQGRHLAEMLGLPWDVES